MALFGFGKKKEGTPPCCSGEESKAPCTCNGHCEKTEVQKARFVVLGACCQKSTETFANVKQAVKDLGLVDEVLNIGDAEQIAMYGVMQTPAFVIQGKVVSYGKLIKVEEAKRLIEKAGLQQQG